MSSNDGIDVALRAAVDEKIRLVRGPSVGERDEIGPAAAVVPTLVRTLRLGEFLGHVRLDRKPRFLLHFTVAADSAFLRAGDEAVLKIYGDRPRGEGSMLATWRERGLGVPECVSGELNGCSWLLLRYLDLDPVVTEHDDAGRLLDLTAELATAAPALHQPAPQLGMVLRDLDRLMLPRWDAAVKTLRRNGFDVPDHWRARTACAYRAGPAVPLHGDLGLPNIGRGPGGRLIIYDPSALLGPVEFDAVRWAARISSTSLPPRHVLTAWQIHEDVTTAAHVDDLLAAESVLEAGSALVRDSRAQAGVRVQRLLEEAGRAFE